MKLGLLFLLLGLTGCASPRHVQIVKVPVPVQVPCPAPILPKKPDLSALAALSPADSPQTVMTVVLGALKKLAEDDQQLRALLGGS